MKSSESEVHFGALGVCSVCEQKVDLRRQLKGCELSETRVTELQTLLVSTREESGARQQRLEAAEHELGLLTRSREHLSSEARTRLMREIVLKVVLVHYLIMMYSSSYMLDVPPDASSWSRAASN